MEPLSTLHLYKVFIYFHCPYLTATLTSLFSKSGAFRFLRFSNSNVEVTEISDINNWYISAFFIVIVQVSGFQTSESNFEVEHNPRLILQEPIGGWKPIPRPQPGSRPGPNYKWTCTNCKCATGGLSCKWQKLKRSKQKKYRPTNIITSR